MLHSELSLSITNLGKSLMWISAGPLRRLYAAQDSFTQSPNLITIATGLQRIYDTETELVHTGKTGNYKLELDPCVVVIQHNTCITSSDMFSFL